MVADRSSAKISRSPIIVGVKSKEFKHPRALIGEFLAAFIWRTLGFVVKFDGNQQNSLIEFGETSSFALPLAASLNFQ